jgi:hypothetical protein
MKNLAPIMKPKGGQEVHQGKPKGHEKP